MQPFVRLAMVLLLGAILATSSDATSTHGAGHEGKIDPYLKLVLRDPSRVLSSQALQDPDRVGVLLRASSDISSVLEGYGAEVRTVIGGGAVITAVVPKAAIPSLAALPEVQMIEGSKPLFRMGAIPRSGLAADPEVNPLDVSVSEISAPRVWALTDGAGNPIKGKGVIVGVVDSGIDWRHGDFKNVDGTTRILSVWDQAATGPGPAGTQYKYGVECTRDQINANNCAEKDEEGHGTHVTSIAAGNGRSTSPAKQIGVAPEADIILVKWPTDAALAVDAWTYIINKAQAAGKSVVINNSWGGFFGARDGSDALETVIDLLAGPGKIFVNAAGNAGGQPVHAQGTLAAGSSTTVTFGFPGASSQNVSYATVWYKGDDSMSVSVKTPVGETFGPVAKGKSTAFTSTDGTEISVDATLAPYPVNGDNAVLIALSRPAGTKMSGNWGFTLTGDIIRAGGRFDSWLALAGSGTEVFTSSHGTLDMSLGEPATARRTITVANYVTKRCIQSTTLGSICNSSLPQTGIIDPSSSRGPTRDNREKPDIAAPGAFIVAALSADSSRARPGDPEHFKVDPDGRHIALEGTSMAAPHITGVVALMLQKKPSLTPEDVKTALLGAARKDGFTGNLWNSTWGRGKVDAFAAINKVVAGGIATPPQLGGPAAGSVLTSLGAGLSWTNPPGTTQYQIQVLPANNDGPALNLIRNVDSSFALQAPVIGAGPYVMLPDMSYTWRVRATDVATSIGENDGGWGPWSAAKSFRTPVRNSSRISAVAPANGATTSAVPQVLRWDNADRDVFYYEVQMSPDPTFETDPAKATSFVWTNLVHGGVSSPASSWTTPALQPNVTYHWRLRPRVQGDGTPVAWSAASSFRTGAQ